MVTRTFYGDPDEPIEEKVGHAPNPDEPPEEGDELCDGHQAHYEWKDGRWQ